MQKKSRSIRYLSDFEYLYLLWSSVSRPKMHQILHVLGLIFFGGGGKAHQIFGPNFQNSAY